ncbi:MAG: L,D-transpeptidase family protein [Steroidobacteraceae bacterium]
MRFRSAAAFAITGLVLGQSAYATQFELTDDTVALVGNVERLVARFEDSLPDLARSHSLGYEEIQRANPGVDVWLPGAGVELVLPGQRVLPPGPREGIVINLPEHRLYYYPKPKRGKPQLVYTYPVSIGKMDWQTPLGATRIVSKRANPVWYPPESVRKEHAERGDPLPRAVPAGPDNPLGLYAMRLGIPGGAYLLHGTNNPLAVGMAVTHGCIRMYPEDIESLYPQVPVGTTVRLINEPVKVARIDGQVWLEVHPPVDAEGQTVAPYLPAFEARLSEVLGDSEAAINWEIAQAALAGATGLPVMVGLELQPESAPQGEPGVPATGPTGSAANVARP